ncbi:MAG: hypothetical protein JWL87_198 [Candidatus Adlerbacteria bacterium]|nr:hypothetical protein [Candidatus Adlerbacteria bacterium]
MENPLHNLKNEAAKLAMTPAEKSAMKARIFGAPSPQAAPKQSPYFIFSFQFVQARVLAPAMVLLVVFVGASTAGAAQGSLPGDFLYPIKVSINETVEIALATTPVAKAEVSAKLAERRVEEAETLAAQGELTAETGHALAANFEVHAENAKTLAAEVEAEDPAAATELRTNLESSLSAHSAILATLGGGTQANQDGAGAVAAKIASRTIASALPANAPAALMRSAKVAEPAEVTTMMAMSVTVATDTATDTDATVSLENDMIEEVPGSPEEEQRAAKLEMRAADALAAARVRFDAGKEKIDPTAITAVSGEFVGINRLMEQGSTTLAEGRYAEASDLFAEALRKSIKLDVLLKAQSKIDRNIITPVLEQSLIVDTVIEADLPR